MLGSLVDLAWPTTRNYLYCLLLVYDRITLVELATFRHKIGTARTGWYCNRSSSATQWYFWWCQHKSVPLLVGINPPFDNGFDIARGRLSDPVWKILGAASSRWGWLSAFALVVKCRQRVHGVDTTANYKPWQRVLSLIRGVFMFSKISF